MSYEYHLQLFLNYQHRLDNKEYRSPKEKQTIEEHAEIHRQMAAAKMPDTVLQQAGIRPIQQPFLPKFGYN